MRSLASRLLVGLGAVLLLAATVSGGGASVQRSERVLQRRGLEAHALRARELRRARTLDVADGNAGGTDGLVRLRGADRESLADPAAPVPEPGDLISASGDLSRVLRLVPRNMRGRVASFPVEGAFVSRGVAHDSISGLVAIAAVSRVLLYDPATELTTVLERVGEDEPLAFVNDVLFDDAGRLIIADMGEVTDAKLPADGRLWQYDPLTGESRELGTKRRLRNPSLLAKDSAGRVFFVDASSGRRIVSFLEPRWDAVFRLRGAKRLGARNVFRGEGIQATGFDVGPDDRLWFANVSEIVILEGRSLESPCPIRPRPFDFATGLVVVSETEARVTDGTDVTGSRRTLQDIDDQCSARVRLKGRKLDGARGLALVEPAPE